MPRTRAWRRHHRARVIASRVRTADRYYGSRQEFVHPPGALTDNQYWLGCNRARCGMCHPSKRWHTSADRMQAEREWRSDWAAEFATAHPRP